MPDDQLGLLDAFRRFQEDVVLETSDHALSTLNSMVSSGTIDLAPVFQRRDRWGRFKQSQLIESFILNIPVPPIYLAEGEQGRYDVIDGKQRLTAINQYLDGQFSLSSLERFSDLNGARFDDLPPDIVSTLNFRPLRTVTLLRQSSNTAKYEVFHRLNSGGQILNPQEIRNVLYRGPLNDLIYELSEDSFLRQQLKIGNDSSPAYKKMKDAEWVLRFFTLRRDWQSFSGDYRTSMDHFMKDNQYPNKDELDAFQEQFDSAIGLCESVFGRNAFKRPEGGSWRDQALAGVYDAEMVAFAELPSTVTSQASEHSADITDAVRERFQNDGEFEQSVRQATNTPTRVRYRISTMMELIQQTIL